MNLAPFTAAMIRSYGSGWTSSTSGTTFKAMGPTGNSLSVPADSTISPGEVLTRTIDSVQYLVLCVDNRQIHLALSVAPISHRFNVTRAAGDGPKDSFGRSISGYTTIAADVPAHLQGGKFSVNVNTEPDKISGILSGLLLVPADYDIRLADILLFSGDDKFSVKAVDRSANGYISVFVQSIN